MDINQFKKAKKVAEVGRVMPSKYPDMAHRVRGLNNSDAEDLRRRIIQDIPAEERVRGIGAKRSKEIQIEVIARAVWLETTGLTDGDEPITLDQDKLIEILSDPENGDYLLDDISDAAARIADAELFARKSDAKN